MNRNRLMSMILALGLVSFAGLGLASGAQGQELSKSISISRDGVLGGQALPKGTYTVKFAGDKDGQIVVFRGSHEVSKTAYKITKLAKVPADTVVVFTQGDGGTFVVKRIEFKGMTNAVSFE